MKRQKIRKGIALLSFLLFPVTIFYFSPNLAIQASASGVVAGCLIVFAAQFAASLFFGRAFCAWLCPVAGLTEACSAVTSKTAQNGKTRFIKYGIWAVWMLSIILLFFRAGGVSEVDPLFMTRGGLPLLGIAGHIVYFGMILLIVVMTLAGGKRAFCHTLCWMAPSMALGARIKDALGYPSLKIHADATRCTGCGRCNQRCPMRLDVQAMAESGRVRNGECILCGECAEGCESGALKYRV